LAKRKPYGLLSAGVIAILIGIILLLSIINIISLVEVPSLILLVSGIWGVFIAVLRGKTPGPYEMSAFSTASWGILLASIGALWFLTFRGVTIDFIAVLFFIIIGLLLLLAALRAWSAK